MFLVQAGLFFVVPLFLSISLGLSAIDTGLRLLPLSLTLLLFAAGIPKLRPNASPRRVVRSASSRCSPASFSSSPCSTSAPDPRSSPGRCCSLAPGSARWPRSSGSVTVSAVPDEQSGEVGGLQNTGTQLGSSIGTALAGAVLISALTASFFAGIQNNPDVPDSVVTQAQTELAGGVPFVSDDDLEVALADAGVPARPRTRSRTRTPTAGSKACARRSRRWRCWPRRAAVHPRHPDRAAGRPGRSESSPGVVDFTSSGGRARAWSAA